MDSSASTTRFRFRDHRHIDDGEATNGHISSDSSSVSSDIEEEPELESMTGKGIIHLCSELLELKRLSDEDFHSTIFSDYSTFVRIFEEVKGMENEMMQLKRHVYTQKRLVNTLIDGYYLRVLSQERAESIDEESTCVNPSPESIFEDHLDNILENLDILLSERRLEEALKALELEAGTFQEIQLVANIPSGVLIRYNSAILERKAMIVDQLKLVAENPRVPAPELLKALVGLCRFGDSHRATQLLLKYYHSQIVFGIHDLQYSNSKNGAYIHEVAKLVFTRISQARMSLLGLHREKTTYPIEVMQWVSEEIEIFAACFSKYVQSISDISGGLVTVMEAVHCAVSYCSLLESELPAVMPCLVKHIHPCVEAALQSHIDHFKKVIGIFTSTDTWGMGRYLLSGILSKNCSSVVLGQQPEYCLLTNSGRKFVTLLQAVMEDISPLIAIQLEGPLLGGIMDLFTKYIAILESALTCKSLEKGGQGVNFAVSSEQEVSIITNLSTLVQLLSSAIKSVFEDINHLSFEVDSFILYIQEASDQLKTQFCQKFICRIIYGSGNRVAPETWVGGESNSDISDGTMPSLVFQELFLEMRRLEKLAKEKFVEVDWLLELFRDILEALLVSISDNGELWNCTEEELAVQHSGNFKQFVLDVQFLVEIARQGGYSSNNIITASMDLLLRMESACRSAKLDPKRDIIGNRWALNAANQALEKLQQLKESEPTETNDDDDLDLRASEDYSGNACDSFEDDRTSIFSGNSLESSYDNGALNSNDAITKLEDPEIEIDGDAILDMPKKTQIIKSPEDEPSVSDLRTTVTCFPLQDEVGSQFGGSEQLNQELEEGFGPGSSGTHASMTETGELEHENDESDMEESKKVEDRDVD